MELLLPAGSPEALVAAVQSGADAVYLGGEKFGARRGAVNFTNEEMEKWVNYCHLYGVLVYVTVNTLVKDSEIEELAEYVRALSDIGVDALLVQDFGALSVIKSVAPQLPVHASTQMTATTPEDVNFLKKQGFSRVVLSRELTKAEVKRICSECECEIEVFVHGALCMCYSGQCLFSSIIGGRSGNRGACAQPCRLPYTLEVNGKAEAKGFLLSPKDLCLLNQIDELGRMGVTSLKIEGRLKRPEYVATAALIYRKYIDCSQSVSESDLRWLSDAFGRGFTGGLFGGERGGKMMSLENSSNAAENKFSDEAKNRSRIDSNFRKIPVFIHGEAKIGNNIKVTVTDCDGNSADAVGAVCEKAKKSPTGEERFKGALLKLGSTPFECLEISIDMDEAVAASISEINAVRREACESLTKIRCSRVRRETQSFSLPAVKVAKHRDISIFCDVLTKQQAQSAFDAGIETVFAPPGVFPQKCITKCPPVTKSKIKDGVRYCISNVGQIDICSNKELFGSHRLNITNSLSADFYSKYLKAAVLSPELRLEEIKELTARVGLELGVISYGRLDLMLCENCPVAAVGKCSKGKKENVLHDRRGERFPLICSEDCRLRILNSKPIYMADKWKALEDCGISFATLVMTTETPEECTDIINAYIDAKSGKTPYKMKENTFTRGHFYRRVL